MAALRTSISPSPVSAQITGIPCRQWQSATEQVNTTLHAARLGVQHPILRALALAEDPGALDAGLAGWGAGAAAGRATAVVAVGAAATASGHGASNDATRTCGVPQPNARHGAQSARSRCSICCTNAVGSMAQESGSDITHDGRIVIRKSRLGGSAASARALRVVEGTQLGTRRGGAGPLLEAAGTPCRGR
jgi:hypothetical protein